MAHLWTSTAEEWQAVPLDDAEDEIALSEDPSSPITPVVEGSAPGARLVRSRGTEDGDPELWVLLAGSPASRVQVNALPLVAGMKVLGDRDEIRLGSSTRYFLGLERVATVEPFPLEKPLACARCRQDIQPASPAVRCPLCEAWHHQDETYACWTYAETCAMCDRSTDLDAGFAFTPEDL